MKDLNINFMGQRKLAASVSIFLLLASIVGLFVNGLKLGLDFSSGTLIELQYNEEADLEQVREVLKQQSFNNAVAVPYGSDTEVMIRFQGSFSEVATDRINSILSSDLGLDARVASVGRMSSEYQSRVVVDQANLNEHRTTLFPESVFGPVVARNDDGETQFLLRNDIDNSVATELVRGLSEASGSEIQLMRSEFVGAQVGEELSESAIWAALTSLAVVMLYVALRFQYKFSVGAVTALIHDVIIVLGLFSIFRWDFDLTVFAAILAVIGYSLNDTIVVSDRMRENFRKIRKGDSIDIINTSLNQTFGRTLVTSLTTLLVLSALFFIGGETIHNFSLALIIGVLVGTYSSIYVAANVMLAMNITKEDLIVPVKEGAEFDEIP